MKKPFLLFSFILFLYAPCFSQDELPDSAKLMSGITVRSFEQNRKQDASAVVIKIIDNINGDRYNKTSLVNGFNSIAGVRMEERSPGSYRINIRGSSLRSPFGVRNVKVYWNDIPVTDPGGNTYFNQFAYNNFSGIEIFKGPAGSLYGAGTGGLIQINNLDHWKPGLSLEYITGSYSLQNIFSIAQFGKNENRNQFSFAHNQTDGYRVQTAMRRDNFSWISQLKISGRQQLTASVLFSDLYYQTPGALTLTEFNTAPRAARPAGGGFPGAVAAHAAIYQKNILAGIKNEYELSPGVKNTTVFYGAFAEIKNPAIRNFERRDEPHFGGRTTLTWMSKQKRTDAKLSGLQLVGGSEFQQGYFNTQVSKNKNGNPDTLQTNDDIRNTLYSFFIQGDYNWHDKWLLLGGVSFNKTNVRFTRLNVYPVIPQGRIYRNEMAPKFSVVRKWDPGFYLMATLSKGFSPPTVAELLPSTGVISTGLEAEKGWNYELTIRKILFHSKLELEATGFYFKLNNALVQRRDASGADYFINAGDIREKGIELHAHYTCIPAGIKWIDYLVLNTDYTYNHFRYGSFIKGTDDFSGKKVPGIPDGTFSATADLYLKNGLYSNFSFYTASEIMLNDANTVKTGAYHLLGWRLGWKTGRQKKQWPFRLNLYAGADNLLNEKYSLGNDINAAGGRYFNAAPARNYYLGCSIQRNKPSLK